MHQLFRPIEAENVCTDANLIGIKVCCLDRSDTLIPNLTPTVGLTFPSSGSGQLWRLYFMVATGTEMHASLVDTI